MEFLSFRKDPYLAGVPVAIIQSWYQRRGYVTSMADLIEKELQNFSDPKEVELFLPYPSLYVH